MDESTVTGLTAPWQMAGLLAGYGMVSETGPHREVNEDAALASPPLFLVADGMGGHGLGDRAAAASLTPFAQLAGARIQVEDVYEAMRRASALVDELAAIQPGDKAPGSTLSGLALVDYSGRPAWMLLNLGDSRTYRLSDGELKLRTQDHSEVAELVRAGQLTVAEAARHPRRNVVTRALGQGMPNLPDYELAAIGPGERWLICSDGLSGALSDQQLLALLSNPAGAAATARMLVDEALEAGSRDNVTAIVVDVSGGAPSEPIDEDTVRRGAPGDAG